MKPTYFNESIKRAIHIAENKTTDMADEPLRVPLHYYRNDALRISEREQIMLKTPLPVLTSAEVANANDYVVRELFGKSVLIVRGDDGIARAFENYCRHRGATIASGCGNRGLFACPYHAWSYDSRGRLTNIPGKDGFPDVTPDQMSMLELPSEELGGMIWVTLTPGVDTNVAEFLGPQLTSHLKAWNFQDASYIETREFSVEANWKAVIENFGETYHFQSVHGQSIPGQTHIPNTSTHEVFGLHHFMCFPIKNILALKDVPEQKWSWADGVVPVYWIFPGTIIVAPQGIAQFIEVLPTYSDVPDQTHIRSTFLTFQNMSDPQEAEIATITMNASWEAVYDEDRPMLEKLGEAIRNTSQETMIIGKNEIGVQHIVKTIAGQLQYDLMR